MRINKYIALASGMSRRAADAAIAAGKVQINGARPTTGQAVTASDIVTLEGRRLDPPEQATTIILNKPAGYVCSRNGQGSKTIYELLPTALHTLKPVGRLDKYSSGLLLLTNDGTLANQLTHPRYAKQKIYTVTLNKQLKPEDRETIQTTGVMLEDGISKFAIAPLKQTNDTQWEITMAEGRNRQIRRTFAARGYSVTRLNRVVFGPYHLATLGIGKYETIN